MTRKLVRLLATWFGCGMAPKAPGTFGTLGAWPLVWWLSGRAELVQMIAIFLLIIVAIAVAHAYEVLFRNHDASEVVIDEVAGYSVAAAFLPATWHWWLSAFVLFRIFDIWKPWPIRWLDQRVRGGLGVVLDDIAAGLVSNLLLWSVYSQIQ